MAVVCPKLVILQLILSANQSEGVKYTGLATGEFPLPPILQYPAAFCATATTDTADKESLIFKEDVGTLILRVQLVAVLVDEL